MTSRIWYLASSSAQPGSAKLWPKKSVVKFVLFAVQILTWCDKTFHNTAFPYYNFPDSINRLWQPLGTTWQQLHFFYHCNFCVSILQENREDWKSRSIFQSEDWLKDWRSRLKTEDLLPTVLFPWRDVSKNSQLCQEVSQWSLRPGWIRGVFLSILKLFAFEPSSSPNPYFPHDCIFFFSATFYCPVWTSASKPQW